MSTNAKTASGAMKGGVRKRGGLWAFTLYLGLQPAQRCVDCEHREWLAAQRLEACPKCGGRLREAREARQFTRGGFATREAAAVARAAMMTEYHGRGSVPEILAPKTLAEFLRDVYVPTMATSGRLKQTTKEGHRRHVDRHLIGPQSQPFALGMVELRKLTTKQITAHYRRLQEGYVVEGIHRTKYGRKLKDKATGEYKRGLIECRGLSLESIRRVHATLHVALELALSEDYHYLNSNPSNKATKELGDADAVQRELPAWSEEELLAFLASERDTPLGPLWHFLAYTGARRGEALGLQRGDVDLEGATITIKRTRVPVKGEGRGKPGRFITSGPKAKKPRIIDLDPQTVEVLRSVLWSTVSPADLDQAASAARWVFADEAGEPLNSNTVSYRFRKAAMASAQRTIPMHGLRHTHATILLTRGVPVHIVSARLGHADPVITMRVYAHCLPRAQKAAVDVLASMGAECSE